MLSRTQVAELFTKFKSAHQEYSAALQNGDNPDFEQLEANYQDLLKQAKDDFSRFDKEEQEYILFADNSLKTPHARLLLRRERSRSESRAELTMDSSASSVTSAVTATGNTDDERQKFIKERDDHLIDKTIKLFTHFKYRVL